MREKVDHLREGTFRRAVGKMKELFLLRRIGCVLAQNLNSDERSKARRKQKKNEKYAHQGAARDRGKVDEMGKDGADRRDWRNVRRKLSFKART